MNINPEQLDPAFYTYGDTSAVWEEDGNPYIVLCAGEMKIYAIKDGEEYTLRTTADLASFGITTDAQLAEWMCKGDEVFFWENNSWFEVRNEDTEEYSEVFHSLDEAVAYAREMAQRPDTNNQPAD
jgi:hypothetical protein